MCFPQFGKLGPLGQHGFARNSAFTIADRSSASVTLKLQPTEEQLAEAKFPHQFELLVKVCRPRGSAGQAVLVCVVQCRPRASWP